MNILITGPGAIGCLFAGLLSEAGNSVQLLARNDEQAAILNKQGIKIKETRTRTVKLSAITDAGLADPPDFICICVKSFDTARAIRHSIPAIAPETVVVSIQNGIGNAEAIMDESGCSNILCVVTSQGATSLGTGKIKHAGNGPTAVAPFTAGALNAASSFARILTDAGIETSKQDDAEAMLWSKLVINAAINPTTAVSDLSNGEILKSPELSEVMRAAAKEAEQVAHAKGITLNYMSAEDEAERICRATARNISSMLQDIRSGKRTEIDAITGSIITEAEKYGIDVPTNEVLMQEVNKLSGQAE